MTELTSNSGLVPSKRRWGVSPHALRDDVDMVTAKLKELDQSKLELEEWKEQRLLEVRDRREVRTRSYITHSRFH